MNELRNILEESVNRLFADHLDWDALTHIEETGWPGDLWQQVVDQGIHLVLADEAAGGMNGVWADAFPIIRACGRYAVPLPVSESIVAMWLARQARCTLPDGVPGLITKPLTDDDVSIPWGRHADYLIGVADSGAGAEVIVASTGTASFHEAHNLGLDPRDVLKKTLTVDARYAVDVPPDVVHWLGAMCRAAQIAGAGAACLELAVNYACEREQFGRTLSRYQAIQHHLADLAGTMASVDAIAIAAFEAVDRTGIAVTGRNARFEIAAAKCRASEAVEKLTKLSHQVHGAIGFTYEYGLHFLTRKLWAWRAEFGGAGEWGEYLGRIACEDGGEKIWSTITG